MTYPVYLTNGEKFDITTEKKLTLGQMQAIVGGYIETTPGDRFGFPGTKLVVNEDGIAEGLKRNQTFIDTTGGGTALFGVVLVCKGNNLGGFKK